MLATSYEIRSANAWRRERQPIKIQAFARQFLARCQFVIRLSNHRRRLRVRAARKIKVFRAARKIQALYRGHFSRLDKVGWQNPIRLAKKFCCRHLKFSPSKLDDRMNQHDDPDDDFFFGTHAITIIL